MRTEPDQARERHRTLRAARSRRSIVSSPPSRLPALPEKPGLWEGDVIATLGRVGAHLTPRVELAGSSSRPSRMRRQLEASTAHPRVPTAFVMGGGGSRGAVQVGMLEELARRAIEADMVLGVSAGAINAAAYAGDPTPAGIARMADVWLSAREDDVFPHPLIHGRWQFVQHRESVFPLDGLRRVIEKGLSYDLLEDARVPVSVVATSMLDGHERWFTRGPAVEAVLASSAAPGVFPPVIIDGEPYADGGIVNDVPLLRALELGARRCYVLLCGPIHPPAPVVNRPLDALSAAFKFALHTRFRQEVATIARSYPPEHMP